MIRNIDLYVQIPGLSRTSTNIPGLYRPGIQIFKFQVFKDLCEPCIMKQKVPFNVKNTKLCPCTTITGEVLFVFTKEYLNASFYKECFNILPIFDDIGKPKNLPEQT